MATIIKFTIRNRRVPFGNSNGKKQIPKNKLRCNEPFKKWFWCQKKEWFMKEACPFINRNECEMYDGWCTYKYY